MSYLYSITNLVNGKQYYGITNNPERRWKEHKREKGSRLIYRAIQKYGIDNFCFKVLCDGKEADINELEKIMIQEECSKVPYGYNLEDGGGGHTGWHHTEESKKKMSISSIGKRHSHKAKEKISIANIGRTHSPESKEKMSISQIGIKNHRYGKRNSKEHKRKCSRPGANNPNAKPVLIDGIKYGCIKDAAISLNHNYDSLKNKFRRYKKNNNFPENWGFIPKGDNK